jgi:hypothetical protein
VAKVFHSVVTGTLKDTLYGIKPHIEIFHGRAKGDADEVMARRAEEITPVRRVDLKEYS